MQLAIITHAWWLKVSCIGYRYRDPILGPWPYTIKQFLASSFLSSVLPCWICRWRPSTFHLFLVKRWGVIRTSWDEVTHSKVGPLSVIGNAFQHYIILNWVKAHLGYIDGNMLISIRVSIISVLVKASHYLGSGVSMMSSMKGVDAWFCLLWQYAWWP